MENKLKIFGIKKKILLLLEVFVFEKKVWIFFILFYYE